MELNQKIKFDPMNPNFDYCVKDGIYEDKHILHKFLKDGVLITKCVKHWCNFSSTGFSNADTLSIWDEKEQKYVSEYDGYEVLI